MTYCGWRGERMRPTLLRALPVLLLITVAGCATSSPSAPPPTTVLHAHIPSLYGDVGRLRGDPKVGCTWIDNRGSRTQTIWPRDVKVVFSPLRLIQAGKIVASDGEFVDGELVSDHPVRGKPGCPVHEAQAVATVYSAGRTRPPAWP